MKTKYNVKIKKIEQKKKQRKIKGKNISIKLPKTSTIY